MAQLLEGLRRGVGRDDSPAASACLRGPMAHKAIWLCSRDLVLFTTMREANTPRDRAPAESRRDLERARLSHRRRGAFLEWRHIAWIKVPLSFVPAITADTQQNQISPVVPPLLLNANTLSLPSAVSTEEGDIYNVAERNTTLRFR